MKRAMKREEAIALLRGGRIWEWNRRRESLEQARHEGAWAWARIWEWNRRRESGEILSLSGANLSGLDLSRANLSGANLSGANLSGANLFGADLSGADLSGANLSGADLSGVYLSWANLSRANLSRANLSKANISGADLSGADLTGADLTGARSPEGSSRQSPITLDKDFLTLDKDFSQRGGGTYAEPLPPALDKRPTQRLKGLVRRVSLLIGRLISLDWRLADPVDCTVFAPPSVARGDWLLVQVFAHRPDQAEETRGLAKEVDEHARKRGFKSLEMGIERGTSLTFHLRVPGIEFATSTQRLVWQGRPTYVQFAAQAPSEIPIGTVIGKVTVSRDNIPIGSIMFRLEIVEKNEPPRALIALLCDTNGNRRRSLLPVGDRVRRYKKAFISYAMKDLPEVLKRVQMLRVARIRYFQDVLKLEPGDRWERKLYRHIDRSDLFLLFWSTNAKESKWVLEEVRYAIKRKGGNDLAPPDVIPVIIEGPPVPHPPEDLAYLHFNDYLLYFMLPPEAKHQEEKP